MVIKKIWQGWHKGIFLLLALPILRSHFLTPSKLIKQQSERACETKAYERCLPWQATWVRDIAKRFRYAVTRLSPTSSKETIQRKQIDGKLRYSKHFFIPNVGVRMLDGQATDVLEGSSLSFQSEYIDIYSNCWGPKDDGKTFGKPGKLAQEALMQGALKVKTKTTFDVLFIY